MLVPLDRLRPGDRVAVGADESVPADGRIIAGEGIVDERSVRGLEGASRKRVGDGVLAGSTVLAGSLRIEVTAAADRTRASSIARALVAATSPAAGPTSPTLRAERFAEKAVPPTLATAGVGLLVGDLTAAVAILRPDYATGPALAVPLETLRNAARLRRRGIVVRQPDAFDRLAEVDLIVLDDDPALRRVELEVSGLRTRLPETELLRLAASAFRHLADDRVAALESACRARRAHLLNLPPVGFDPGVTVVHGKHRVCVRESDPAAVGSGPLLVEVDGSPVGVIRFARTSRPEAAAALRRLRDAAPVPVALVSGRPEAEVAPLASLLGVPIYKSDLEPGDTARFLKRLPRAGPEDRLRRARPPPAGPRRRGPRRHLARRRRRRRFRPRRGLAFAGPTGLAPRFMAGRPVPRIRGPRRPEDRPRPEHALRGRRILVRVHEPDLGDDQQPRHLRALPPRRRPTPRAGAGRARPDTTPEPASMIQSSGEFTTLESLQESTGWQTRRLPGEAGPPEGAPAPIEDHATTNDLVSVVPEGDAGPDANNARARAPPGSTKTRRSRGSRRCPRRSASC